MTQAHAERGHALLGASKASQWLNCPPSARLQEGIPDKRSEYANEGTLAHELAELKLRKRLKSFVEYSAADHLKSLKTIQNSEYYGQEMEDAITEYADIVEEHFAAALARSSDAVVLLEEPLDFSEWVPQGYGTGDVVIISDGVLEILDLKFGKGIPVSATENPQMKLYALGALASFNYLYGIKEVHMTIVQPRLDNVSTYSMDVDSLLDWAETMVRPLATLAFAGEGEFKSGDHCRFCKVKATCRARSDENMRALQYEFREPALIPLEEIGSILVIAQQLKSWANDVEEYAFEQAKSGSRIPLWKLVAGRSNRTIRDKDVARTKFESAGFKPEQFLKPQELFGIGDLEKRIGKKELAALLGDLIFKPEAKPVLVPETDKRPELNSIDSEFAGEEFSEPG